MAGRDLASSTLRCTRAVPVPDVPLYVDCGYVQGGRTLDHPCAPMLHWAGGGARLHCALAAIPCVPSLRQIGGQRQPLNNLLERLGV